MYVCSYIIRKFQNHLHHLHLWTSPLYPLHIAFIKCVYIYIFIYAWHLRQFDRTSACECHFFFSVWGFSDCWKHCIIWERLTIYQCTTMNIKCSSILYWDLTLHQGFSPKNLLSEIWLPGSKCCPGWRRRSYGAMTIYWASSDGSLRRWIRGWRWGDPGDCETKPWDFSCWLTRNR